MTGGYPPTLTPYSRKQAVEVTFSRKKTPTYNPPLFFNDVPVMEVDEYRHLGVVLDSGLTFSGHIQSAINKTGRGIIMLRLLFNYLPRKTLN